MADEELLKALQELVKKGVDLDNYTHYHQIIKVLDAIPHVKWLQESLVKKESK